MRTVVLAAGVAVLATVHPGSGQGRVEPLGTPAGGESGMYSLATGANNETYLSWIEPATGDAKALRFARFNGRAWDPPARIVEGSDWFVNWADHPSLHATQNGRLYAHWLVNTATRSGAYGYAIRVQSSSDQGQTWTTVFEEGLRNVSDYSGFLTFLPTGDTMNAVYLTPLEPDDAGKEGDHVKTLGVVRFGPNGTERDRAIVDRDVCSCCSTDIAETALGPVAVYRDHQAGEVRDISIVRFVDGAWTAPAPVHRDGWVINGCPTNGPAVAASGRHVSVAWFTAASDQPRVKVAFSSDAGVTFSPPITVDDGNPVGWPDVALLPGNRTVVSWLERDSESKGSVRVREVTGSRRSDSLVVAAASSGRTTGIPMMARLRGGDLIVAWRDGGVRTARVTLPLAPSTLR